MKQSNMHKKTKNLRVLSLDAYVSNEHDDDVSGEHRRPLMDTISCAVDVAVEVETKMVVSEIFNRISDTEIRMLTMKAEECTYAEIAEEIHVSRRCVKRMMKNLRNRMAACYPELAATYGPRVSCCV